jgi:hypothetical protein
MYIISNLISLVTTTSIDKQSFLKSFDSLDSIREQDTFLYKFAKEHEKKDVEQLLDDLLDIKTSNVREQTLGIRLVVAYRDQERLYRVLTEDTKYPATVLLIASKYSALVLSEDEEKLRELLFKFGTRLTPLQVYAILQSIGRWKNQLINRELVLKVYEMFDDVAALKLLGHFPKSDKTSCKVIADILWKDMKMRYIPYFGTLVRNHPDSILMYLEYLFEDFKCDSIKSYTDEIHPGRTLFENKEYTCMLTMLIRCHREMAKCLMKLLMKWFVDPAKKHHVTRPFVPVFILSHLKEFCVADKKMFMQLMECFQVFKHFDCPVTIHLPFHKLTIQDLLCLFDQYAQEHIVNRTQQSDVSRSVLDTFILRMPHNSVSEIHANHWFHKKLHAEYKTDFEDWLYANMDIQQVSILHPTLGDIVAKRLYERALKSDAPLFENFLNKSYYWKFIEEYLEEEKLEEWMQHISINSDSCCRAQIYSGLLFGTLYHRKSISKVLNLLIERMKCENKEVWCEFWKSFMVPYRGENHHHHKHCHKHHHHHHKKEHDCHKIYVDVFHELDIPYNEEYAKLFKQLILMGTKFMDGTRTISNLLYHLVDKSTRGNKEGEVKRMTQYIYEIAMEVDGSRAFELMTGSDPLYINWTRVKFCMEQLMDLMYDCMHKKLLVGDYTLFSEFILLARWKGICLSKCDKIVQLYSVFIQSVLSGRSKVVMPRKHSLPPVVHLLNSMSQVVGDWKKRRQWIESLLDADPSLIVAPYIQRFILGRDGCFKILEKFLTLTGDKCLMSYETLMKLHPKGRMLLVRENHTIVTFNPMIIKQQRINRLPTKIRCCLTRMMVYGATEIMRSDISRSNVNEWSYRRNLMWWTWWNNSRETPQSGALYMLRTVGRLIMEKEERDSILKLLEDTILSRKATDDYPRIVHSVPHLATAMLVRVMSPLYPEEHFSWLFESVKPEYAVYFYSGLTRLHGFIPREDFIDLYLEQLKKKEESGYDENWNAIVHRFYVSYMKQHFSRGIRENSSIEKKLVTHLIELFKNDKVHRDVKVMIIDSLITFIVNVRNGDADLLDSVWPILESVTEEDYIEIPKILIRSFNWYIFQCIEMKKQMVHVLSELLDSDHAVVQEQAWYTLERVLRRMCYPEQECIDELVEKSVQCILCFDLSTKHMIACNAIHILFHLCKHDVRIMDRIVKDVFIRLLSDQKFKKLDEEKYNATLEWDLPVQERVTIMCWKLTRFIQREVYMENDEFVDEVEERLIEPLVQIMIKHDPLLYFSRGFKIRFALAEWREERSIRDVLINLVEDLVVQVKDEKERNVWFSTILDNFIDTVFSDGYERDHVLLEVIDSFATKLFGMTSRSEEPRREILESLLVLILHYVGSKLNWEHSSRDMLKMFRNGKKQNDYLQTIARRPIRVRIHKTRNFDHRRHHHEDYYPDPMRRHRRHHM